MRVYFEVWRLNGVTLVYMKIIGLYLSTLLLNMGDYVRFDCMYSIIIILLLLLSLLLLLFILALDLCYGYMVRALWIDEEEKLSFIC